MLSEDYWLYSDSKFKKKKSKITDIQNRAVISKPVFIWQKNVQCENGSLHTPNLPVCLVMQVAELYH